MRNTTKILFSGALIGALAFTSVTHAEGEPQTAPAETVPQTPAQQDPNQGVPQTPAQQDPNQGVPQTPAQQDPTQGQTQDAPASTVPQEPAQTQPQVEPATPDAATPDTAQQQPKEPYEVTEFFSDAQRYTIGSVVPEKYRTKTYEITEWQKRHLPAPDADSHWTYMGGNYVLISKADGKIIKARSGDIFFH
ncbi:RcnB family protein [Pantoea sp. FN0307]|uniref:RcnB family protein n=1 Tax=Pantoea sp. FN0307 TaxID=3418560 RepID=UPI003CF2304A